MPPEKQKQISLDFTEMKECQCGRKHEHTHSTGAQTGSAEAAAPVLSFADKLAKKEQENEGRLYDGILSRIKHLNP